MNTIWKKDWLVKTSGLGALAAALAMMAMPADAFAQNGRGGGGRGNGGSHAVQTHSGQSHSARGWSRGNRGGGQAAQSQRSTGRSWSGHRGQARSSQDNGRQWSNRDRSGAGQHWRGRSNGSRASADNSARRQARIAEIERRRGAGVQADSSRRQWSGRNTSYRDPDRNRTYRPDGRSHRERWRGNDRWRGDGNRWSHNGQSRRWNHDWRRDNRYDWRSYRNHHRNIYRLNRYYAPYRGYSYRRLGVGFHLDSLFFGSRYWIDDPWYYRLPPADGPFRWVRYYDDALLVDIYSGEVIDVIYDFFE